MLTIEKVDTDNKSQVKRFVQFYYDLYKDCPEWVPPLYGDAYLPLNRKKHPFFEHSDADFFLAVDDGKVVGRICAADNKPFNKYHQTRKAHFYAFDSINDLQVAKALFDAVFDWSRAPWPRYGHRSQRPLAFRRLRHPDRRLRASPDDDDDELQLRLLSESDGVPRLRERSGFCLLLSARRVIPRARARRAHRQPGRETRQPQGQAFQEQERAAEVGSAYRRGLQPHLHS